MRVGMMRQILLGAAAGAAGTTALNAVTYLDMVWRGRPASPAPQQTIQRVADAAHIPVPGSPEERENRLDALGALGGIATGVAMGALYGLLRAGVRLPGWAGGALATAIALVGANGPMTVLGVTDPRSWSTADWISDVVPHIGYGAVTAATYAAGDR